MLTQVYVIEDHPLMREVLQEVIEKLTGLALCGMARSAEEALANLDTVRADVVLIDLSLPQMSGTELIQVLRARWPLLHCLILSGHNELSYVRQALAAGAHGYILKGDPYELPTAIRHVLAGERYLSDSLSLPDLNNDST